VSVYSEHTGSAVDPRGGTWPTSHRLGRPDQVETVRLLGIDKPSQIIRPLVE